MRSGTASSFRHADVPPGFPNACDASTWHYTITDEIRCTNNHWALAKEHGDSRFPVVNTDHVYDTHFLQGIFQGLVTSNKWTSAGISRYWDVLVRGKLEFGSRLDKLFSRVASSDPPEYMGLAAKLNVLKNILSLDRWERDQPYKRS